MNLLLAIASNLQKWRNSWMKGQRLEVTPEEATIINPDENEFGIQPDSDATLFHISHHRAYTIISTFVYHKGRLL